MPNFWHVPCQKQSRALQNAQASPSPVRRLHSRHGRIRCEPNHLVRLKQRGRSTILYISYIVMSSQKTFVLLVELLAICIPIIPTSITPQTYLQPNTEKQHPHCTAPGNPLLDCATSHCQKSALRLLLLGSRADLVFLHNDT